VYALLAKKVLLYKQQHAARHRAVEWCVRVWTAARVVGGDLRARGRECAERDSAARVGVLSQTVLR
jgi:hypothetical protein